MTRRAATPRQGTHGGDGGDGTRLEPMGRSEFERYVQRLAPDYAADHVAAGNWAADGAVERALRDTRELLPDGIDTPGHDLWNIRTAGAAEPVGVLWCLRHDNGGRDEVFILDLEVFAPHRRRGHASSALRLLTDQARRAGAERLGLHVFGHNHGARRLYHALGFRESTLVWSAPLPLLPSVGTHALPAVSLQPMSEAEVADFREEAERRAEEHGEPDALRRALRRLDASAPEHADQALRHIAVGGPGRAPRRVGVLWYALRSGSGPAEAVVEVLHVAPDERRHGYAGAAVHAMAATAVARGARRLRAVTAGADGASRALWQALGLRETDLVMTLNLDDA